MTLDDHDLDAVSGGLSSADIERLHSAAVLSFVPSPPPFATEALLAVVAKKLADASSIASKKGKIDKDTAANLGSMADKAAKLEEVMRKMQGR